MLEHSFLVALLIIFIAMLVRSVAGFGDAIVALPLLSMLLGLDDAVVLVALTGFASALAIGLGSWHHIDWRGIAPYLLASCVGVPLGLLTLRQVPETWLLGILGMLISLFGVYKLAVPKPTGAISTSVTKRNHRWLAYGLGLFGGMIGSAYGILGPPAVMYGSLQRWSPLTFRATLQGYFLLTSAAIVLGHGLSGLWSQQTLNLFILALPLIGVTVYIGTRIAKRLTVAHFDRLVYVGIIVLGIMLMI